MRVIIFEIECLKFMKRDPHLIRELLRLLEGYSACSTVRELSVDGFSPQEIIEHVQILLDADFLKGKIIEGIEGRPEKYLIHRITWAGHEFLALARNETVWKSALDQIRNAGLSVGFGVLQALLVSTCKHKFNLP